MRRKPDSPKAVENARRELHRKREELNEELLRMSAPEKERRLKELDKEHDNWPKYQTWALLNLLHWMRSLVEAKDPARPWWSSPRKWWNKPGRLQQDALDLAELEIFALLIQGWLDTGRILEKGQRAEVQPLPFLAWRALHIARLFSLTVPRWVGGYLSETANRVVGLTIEGGKADDTLTAVGLYEGPGQTIKKRFDVTERRLWQAFELARLRHGKWVDFDDWEQAHHSAEHRPWIMTGEEALTKTRLRLLAEDCLNTPASTLRQSGGDREIDRAVMRLWWSDKGAGFRREIDERGAPSYTRADTEIGSVVLSEVRTVAERERFAELE